MTGVRVESQLKRAIVAMYAVIDMIAPDPQRSISCGSISCELHDLVFGSEQGREGVSKTGQRKREREGSDGEME